MLPNIGLDLGNLPVVGNLLDGNDNKADGVLGKALDKVADKDPALAKELAFALSETIKEEGAKSDDGKMPKELEGLLKGALDIAANFIPGGGLVKGLLGKIF